ncbi:MAG: hypothetical protein AAF195_03275, partial [Pseudomonadota bacterium]
VSKRFRDAVRVLEGVEGKREDEEGLPVSPPPKQPKVDGGGDNKADRTANLPKEALEIIAGFTVGDVGYLHPPSTTPNPFNPDARTPARSGPGS